MRIVHATQSLAGSTGIETYLLTVADAMQRIGHDVQLYGEQLGDASAHAEALGLRVSDSADALSDELDVVIAHDAVAAADLLAARPDVPQVFIAHGNVFDYYVPPQLDGAVGAIVALSRVAARRLEGAATRVPVVSLTQPVDTFRFRERNTIPQSPCRALVVSNYLAGERLSRLHEACAEAEIELRHVGATGEGATRRVEDAINGADIVIGKGRVIVEAMSCGRATYVYDMWGADGWVTPDSYELVGANGFGGGRRGFDPSAGQLAADLRDYDAALGPWGRGTALRHHRLEYHASAIVDVCRAAAERHDRPSSIGASDAEEMRRLQRLVWRHEGQAHVMTELTKQQDRRIEGLERDLGASREETRDLSAQLDTIRGSASWRITAPLRRLRRKNR